jgi:hypothetical protein
MLKYFFNEVKDIANLLSVLQEESIVEQSGLTLLQFFSCFAIKLSTLAVNLDAEPDSNKVDQMLERIVEGEAVAALASEFLD